MSWGSRRIIAVIILFFILFALAYPAHAVNNIQFGVAQTGYIATGETQSYQFQADPGDVIYIKLTATSGNIWPGVILYGPSGNEAGKKSFPGNCEFEKVITEGGQYTLIVHDGFNGQYTGDYHLQVQRIPSPQNSVSLNIGSLRSGSIDQVGEFDTYTFQGGVNDTIHAKMTLTGGNLWPKMAIYSPSGKQVKSSSQPTAYETDVKLPESGTYTLIAEDGFNGLYTGSYTLMLNVIASGHGGAATVKIPSTTAAAPVNAGGQSPPASLDTSPILIGGGILALLIVVVLVLAFVFLRKSKKSTPDPAAYQNTDAIPDDRIEKGVTHDVFVSYSSDDKHIADAVCARLESRRIRCWIAPRDILPGTNYAESILKAISGSLVFVLVFSSSANKSPHVMREVENAVNSAVPIITFRIDDTRPAPQMKYYIGPIHWLDAMTPPMEKHMDRLVETVELLLKQSERPAEPATPVHSAPQGNKK
jgi:hypothetical protein